MIRQSPLQESDRFSTNHPNLCPALRWKAQFILAEPDPTVPQSNEGLFWCIHTQTCIGPDGSWPSQATARLRGENVMAQDIVDR